MVKAAGDTDFVQNTKEIQVPQNSTMHLEIVGGESLLYTIDLDL
jgi:hypothetical protein